MGNAKPKFAMDANQTAFRRFEIQNGLVLSQTGQQDADDFSADFQGLSHFANRVGATLDLGDALFATLHEADFSLVYSLTGDPGQLKNAIGGMINSNISNNDLLSQLELPPVN